MVESIIKLSECSLALPRIKALSLIESALFCCCDQENTEWVTQTWLLQTDRHKIVCIPRAEVLPAVRRRSLSYMYPIPVESPRISDVNLLVCHAGHRG